MFLTPSDFTGFYQISNGATAQNDNIEAYIASTEPKFLRDLLGNTLYELFVADLVANVPQTQRFIDIFDEFYIDNPIGSGEQVNSLGIKEMLKGFTYYNISRDANYSNTNSGNVRSDFSNSSPITTTENGTEERYNVALGSYNAIRWFICENSATYPEYNGITKAVQTWIDL